MPKTNTDSDIHPYPKFRKLIAKDLEFINNFAAKAPPFSDFIFSNLLNWRLESQPTELSMLNGNLVFRMLDNYGKKIITTFLGYDNYSKTIDTLLKDVPKLYHIPEFVVSKLRKESKNFIVEEDRNDFDYIFSVEKVLDIENADLKTKKREIKNFRNKNPEVEVKLLDPSDPDIQRQLIKLYRLWFKLKTLKGYKKAAECEFNSLMRFLTDYGLFNYSCLGVVKDNELLGFTINEVLGKEYMLCAYTKGDLSYRGLFSFLFNKTAEYAKLQGISFINHEPDMGIEGLRNNKLGWRPVKFLKKYKIMRNKI